MVNGILVLFLGMILIGMPVKDPLGTIAFFFWFLGHFLVWVYYWDSYQKAGPASNDAEFLFNTFKFSRWNILFHQNVT